MIEIKHRFNGKILYTAENAADVRTAVEEAVKNGARLNGASLNGARLNGASLNGVSLNGATLNGATLDYATLNGATLDYASLNGASLNGASLNGASLNGASLNGVSLNGASLNGVLASVPLIENIDATILAAIEAVEAKKGDRGLNMDSWHTCETTHCRAGWAIHLAGKAGYELEERFGPSMAGTLLYLKAGQTRIPNWVASDKDAMADMRERAGVTESDAA